jgi:lactoylglutathione lyase
MRLIAMFLAAMLAGPVLAEAPASPPPAPPSQAPGASFIGAALNVVDLQREIAFYTQALGLKVAATLPAGTRTETILRFPGSGAQASVLLMHDPSPNAPKGLTHGNGFSRLVIQVDDLAALAARLTRLGYARGEVRAGGQGYLILMMNDPEGYRLELVQPGPQRTGG